MVLPSPGLCCVLLPFPSDGGPYLGGMGSLPCLNADCSRHRTDAGTGGRGEGVLQTSPGACGWHLLALGRALLEMSTCVWEGDF